MGWWERTEEAHLSYYSNAYNRVETNQPPGLLTILSNSIADINTDTFVKSIDDTDTDTFAKSYRDTFADTFIDTFCWCNLGTSLIYWLFLLD